MITIPTNAYPLTWPVGVPRTKVTSVARFKGARIVDEVATIFRELTAINGANLVISSNVPLKANGLPYSEEPGRGIDAGVAVYWALPDVDLGRVVPHAMPCDRWSTVADNLHAIALSLNAMRALERWGAVTIAQAFAGFAALPPGPGDAEPARPWREVLGGAWPELEPEDLLGLARTRHRRAMQTAHPDKGGTAEAAAALNIALERAEAEIGRS